MRRFSSGEEVEVWCIKPDNLLLSTGKKIKLVNDGATALAAGLIMASATLFMWLNSGYNILFYTVYIQT